MALTKGDLKAIRQAVKEEVQPQFDAANQQMEKNFKGVYAALQSLKIYMETEFKMLNGRLDQIDRTGKESKANILKAGGDLEDHEKRINKLETRVYTS